MFLKVPYIMLSLSFTTLWINVYQLIERILASFGRDNCRYIIVILESMPQMLALSGTWCQPLKYLCPEAHSLGVHANLVSQLVLVDCVEKY